IGAGMIAGALSFVISSVLFQLTNITIWIGLGYLVLQMISGGIAGYLAVQLAHIIQRAGLLGSNTPSLSLSEEKQISS
ncbi:MAG: hypothetical protein AAGD96_34870, partial [Chloroflexota bacterium]